MTYRRAALPWSVILRCATLATLALTVVVVLDVRHTGAHVANLVQPGETGPSAEVFHRDFPTLDLPDGTGHDGQQFYAYARAPMHLDHVAPHMDRAHYRLQRPLFPWLAWLLHPTGGGTGLVLAMATVGIAAVLAGSAALGALSVTLGGPAWAALLFPLLPGVYVSLRIGVADALATALVFGAVALSLQGRNRLAVAAGVGAVLTKEPTLLVLAGFALWRRDVRGVSLTVIPAAAALVWAIVVRSSVEATGVQIREFDWPFAGVADAAALWADGRQWWGLASVLVALILGGAALAVRGVGSPLGPTVVLHLATIPLFGVDVIGLDLNAPRAVLPLTVAALVTLLAPREPGAGAVHRSVSRFGGLLAARRDRTGSRSGDARERCQ